MVEKRKESHMAASGEVKTKRLPLRRMTSLIETLPVTRVGQGSQQNRAIWHKAHLCESLIAPLAEKERVLTASQRCIFLLNSSFTAPHGLFAAIATPFGLAPFSANLERRTHKCHTQVLS